MSAMCDSTTTGCFACFRHVMEWKRLRKLVVMPTKDVTAQQLTELSTIVARGMCHRCSLTDEENRGIVWRVHDLLSQTNRVVDLHNLLLQPAMLFESRAVSRENWDLCDAILATGVNSMARRLLVHMDNPADVDDTNDLSPNLYPAPLHECMGLMEKDVLVMRLLCRATCHACTRGNVVAYTMLCEHVLLPDSSDESRLVGPRQCHFRITPRVMACLFGLMPLLDVTTHMKNAQNPYNSIMHVTWARSSKLLNARCSENQNDAGGIKKLFSACVCILHISGLCMYSGMTQIPFERTKAGLDVYGLCMVRMLENVLPFVDRRGILSKEWDTFVDFMVDHFIHRVVLDGTNHRMCGPDKATSVLQQQAADSKPDVAGHGCCVFGINNHIHFMETLVFGRDSVLSRLYFLPMRQSARDVSSTRHSGKKIKSIVEEAHQKNCV